MLYPLRYQPSVHPNYGQKKVEQGLGYMGTRLMGTQVPVKKSSRYSRVSGSPPQTIWRVLVGHEYSTGYTSRALRVTQDACIYPAGKAFYRPVRWGLTRHARRLGLRNRGTAFVREKICTRTGASGAGVRLHIARSGKMNQSCLIKTRSSLNKNGW